MEHVHKSYVASGKHFGWNGYSGRFTTIIWLISILAGIGISLLIVFTSRLIATFLMAGLISVILFFYKREYGLFTLIAITYTYASNVLIVNFGMPSVMKPLVALLVVIILVRWGLYGEKPEGWQRTFYLFAGYGLLGIFSLFYAKDSSITREWLIDFVKDATIALVIAVLVRRIDILRRLIWVLLVSGIFIGSLTSYQALTGTFDNNYWGFSNAVLSHIVGESNDWRSGGPLATPNHFAQTMVILIPLAIERIWNERKQHYRILAIWALVVCILSILYTYSRSAFLGLVIVLAAMLLFRRVKLSVLFAGFVFFLILQPYIPDQYTDRIGTLTEFLPSSDVSKTSEYSFRGRISENLAAWRMFLDNPIFGVGMHNYSVNYQTYSREIGLDNRRVERHPHNFYLEIMSETGILGLMWLTIFLWSTFAGLLSARKALNGTDFKEYDGLIVAIGVSLLGFLFTGFYVHLAFPRYFWIIFGIALVVPNVVREELAILSQTDDATDAYGR